MAELVPQPLEALIRRALAEWQTRKSLFDLPARSLWRGSPLDLSVHSHGVRASTCAGPAAGPHAQLAQNIALSYLVGGRIIELKTIQIQDQLRIPRPCIDATNLGFNVEWSQELRLSESLREYVKGALLLEVLKRLNPGGLRADEMDTLLDVSVGYSLAGIQSDPVARWLDGLAQPEALYTELLDELSPEARRLFNDVALPERLYQCITLSTFHGCPAHEIEHIVEHLFARHDVHVVVKLNPTLLGLETVEHILHERLGYHQIRVHRPAFAEDLQWEDALAMMRRLEAAAERAGRGLGVKFTNTLVVENHKDFFPAEEKLMYLSGAPLHVLAIQLAHRFTEATGGRYPVSFSAGIDKTNFAEVAACGIVPVTACTDLLRPGGYGRMTRYLEALAAAMTQSGARTVTELTAKRGGPEQALRDYAARVLEDPRYGAAKNSSIPRRIGKTLALFDCINCDKCVPVCPNDANFVLDTPLTGPHPTLELVISTDETILELPGLDFRLEDGHQLANFADFCNDCGNCDVFCPETGGPYKIKPRFFASMASYRSDQHDGFYVERHAILGRIQGRELALRMDPATHHATFEDGRIRAKIDMQGDRLLGTQLLDDTIVGHRLLLWHYHAMRALHDGVWRGINPISAPALPLP